MRDQTPDDNTNKPTAPVNQPEAPEGRDRAQPIDPAGKEADDALTKLGRQIAYEDHLPPAPANAEPKNTAKPQDSPAARLAKKIREARPLEDDLKASTALNPPTRPAEDVEAEIERLNELYAVVPVGKGAAILHTPPDGPPALKDVKGFELELANQWVLTGTGKDQKLRQVPKVWIEHPLRRQYRGIEFEPEPGKGRDGYFNGWRGLAVTPKEGCCELFVRHIFEVYCRKDAKLFAYVLQWLALAVQQPWAVPGVALIVIGERGTGKSTLPELFCELFGDHAYMTDSAEDIFGKFNGVIANRVLICLEEGFWAGDKPCEGRIKNLITGRTLTIQNKGIDAYQINNHTKLIVTSNEPWVVPAGADERRYCVMDVSNERKRDYAYFEAIREEWRNGGREAFAHLLLNEPITVNLREAPKTAALLDQKIASFNPAERWWYGRLQDGAQTSASTKWQPFVTKDDLYKHFVEDARAADIGRPGAREDLFKALRKLCPELTTYRPRTDSSRLRAFKFPSLAATRAAFERYVGQEVAWDDDGAGEADPEESL